MGTLATILTELGMMEAMKLISDATLTSSQAASIADKIITAASKKGKSMLNKALNAINNVPVLASSPAVKQHLIQARQEANSNYNDVEQKVDELNSNANKVANEIQGEANSSIFTKAYNLVRTGKTSKQRVEDLANQAVKKIESEV